MRNILEAAKRLKNAGPEEIQLIAKHDWDMIRDVAATLFSNLSDTRKHNEDCELRGGGPCYCKQ